jgi:hypothetical protein
MYTMGNTCKFVEIFSEVYTCTCINVMKVTASLNNNLNILPMRAGSEIIIIIPAGISARRPDISRRASAHRDVESAIMLTLKPISRKYSDKVIPASEIQQYTYMYM